jgi:hypothetical protein
VRGGRVAIAAASVVLLGLVFAGSALACSCAPSSPARSLAESDAALTGRLLSVVPHGLTRAEYRYEVLHVYRGPDGLRPGSIVEVRSPRGSASCALPEAVGRNYGLFLLGDGRRWASGLCGVISPRRLHLAAGKRGAEWRAGISGGCTS